LNIDWFQIIFYKTQPYSVYIIKTGKNPKVYLFLVK